MSLGPSRHGFTLVEMLIVISILAVALAVEGRLCSDTIQAIRTSQNAENQINTLNQMLFTLRQDVWSASGVEIPDSRTIVLSRPDGSASRWLLNESEAIRETGSGEAARQERWGVALSLQARQEGAAIVLHASPNQESSGVEMRFISQVMLARGNR